MKIFNFLGQDDLETGIDKICELPEKQAVNPLFSFLFNSDPLIKWRAVTAMGAVVSQLANKELEAARVIMRRLMWNLNDESGGIGWGSPEAMGEVLTTQKELADEYHRILISYLDPAGNYLEHQILQRGVLWGIGRFAHARPQLAKGSLPLFVPLIDSDDPYVRGLAGWICGFYWDSKENDALRSLAEDDTIITFYHNRQLKEISISSLVNQNV
ncbi:MAG: HEAT repeat domain-containing protein [Deltaproteobacteria bacterium]|nr:HEAT repeat domain-containing protein [Deltaproteobacteria bacterium]